MSLLDPGSDALFPQFAAPADPDSLPIARCAAASPASASRRILIVRTIANGDILMSTPLIAALRREWPDAHLTYLVERREREAIDANPHIDRLLLWNTDYWKRQTRRGNYPLFLYRAHFLRRLLRAEKFDTLVSLMPEDWGWLVDAVGAPETVGVFDTFREYHRQTRTSGRASLYKHAFTAADLPTHRTDQYLLPLRALGISAPANPALHMGYTTADRAAAAEFADREGLGDRFVLIAPRAGWPSRCWPEERWAAFADSLAARHDCRIVLIGGDADRPALESTAAKMRGVEPVIAAGAFGFRQLAALTARALLVASGDTGPMHVASAVGTPYLALFGPTPAERFAPLVGRGLSLSEPVPCGPCHQRRCPNSGSDRQKCLMLISTEAAIAAADRLLKSGASFAFPNPEPDRVTARDSVGVVSLLSAACTI